MPMHRPVSDDQPNIFGVAMVAAAVGAVVGLLLAPKSGDETRAELRDKYNDMKYRSGEAADKARGKVHEGVDSARDKVHDLTDKSRNKLHDAADKIDNAADDAAHQAKLKADEAARKARGPRGL